ncbi:MAG TPA: biopolymer transporter ExbD [Candidatus Binataceae bacterium]|nr:biopolymer transporter ExbD [Candidatus Binataceae bacterium]
MMNSPGSDLFAEINITPLTDIFLVLLIIFMVAAAVTIESAAHVGLSRSAQASNQPQQKTAVAVNLDASRHLYVDGKPVTLANLQSALQRALATTTAKVVVFKGDPRVILGDMVIVLDIAKRAGAQQLGVSMAEPGDIAASQASPQAPATTP